MREGRSDTNFDDVVSNLTFQCKDIIETSDYTADNLKGLGKDLLAHARTQQTTSTSSAVASRTSAEVTQDNMDVPSLPQCRKSTEQSARMQHANTLPEASESRFSEVVVESMVVKRAALEKIV